MATIPSIPTDTSVEALLTDVMPSMAKEMLTNSSAPTELAGTTITMVIDVDGKCYGYTLKDGSSIDYSDGDIDGAMLKIKVSNEHLEKMIETENLDMLVGIQNDLNKAKYNAITSLKGSFIAEVADENFTFLLDVILNGATDPKSTFKMSAADTTALINKETNPVNLFMSGAMKIEGDMAFAMATQPLFT